MISTRQAMIAAALGDPGEIGLWSRRRADRCPRPETPAHVEDFLGWRLLQSFPFEPEKRGAGRMAHRSVAVNPAAEDFFLHVFEIGNTGTTGKKRNELIDGVNFLGAAAEAGPFVLFSASDTASQGGEVWLPDLACDSLIVSGLLPDTVYELSFTGPNVSTSPAAVLPGVLADMLRLRTNNKGLLRLEKTHQGNLRLRMVRI
jgi:hypothetical protein